VLTRGSALAIVAIRSERDRLTPDQHQLLGELRRHPHVLAECWRPSDLSRIKTWLAQPSPHYQGQAPW
jgi:hypothetical protein